MVKRVLVTPFQKFVRIESLSGLMLLGSTLLALILANSPLSEDFQSIWQLELGISAPGFKLIKPLILWINDALMAIFFFPHRAGDQEGVADRGAKLGKESIFPLFAAMGGMLFPVLIYLLLNQNPESAKAWGYPWLPTLLFRWPFSCYWGKGCPWA
jgi:NhaA family Na+:H+ antiporter